MIEMEWLKQHAKLIWWSVVAAGAFFLAVVFKGMEVPEKRKKPKLPDIPPKLRKRVKKAEEGAAVVRAKVKVMEQQQKDRLEAIQKISDDEERRKRLAELMGEL